MKFLVKKRCYGTVGYTLRNMHIAAKEECPDGYMDHFQSLRMGAPNEAEVHLELSY